MGDEAARRVLAPRLSVYRWRAPMIASLAHRLSGVVLALAFPLYLWFLACIAGDGVGFDRLQQQMHGLPGRFLLWVVAVALIYHLLNGIRFLCMDIGWLESRQGMRGSARLVLALALVIALLLGIAW